MFTFTSEKNKYLLIYLTLMSFKKYIYEDLLCRHELFYPYVLKIVSMKTCCVVIS